MKSNLVNNIPTTVEKLNVYKMNQMRDYHVKILVERCTNLKRLDLSFTSTTEQSLIYIVANLNSLEELYWRTSFIIKNGSIVKELLSMPKLKLFTCGYKNLKTQITKKEKGYLKKEVPKLKDVKCISKGKLSFLKFELSGLWVTFNTFRSSTNN